MAGEIRAHDPFYNLVPQLLMEQMGSTMSCLCATTYSQCNVVTHCIDFIFSLFV